MITYVVGWLIYNVIQAFFLGDTAFRSLSDKNTFFLSFFLSFFLENLKQNLFQKQENEKKKIWMYK